MTNAAPRALPENCACRGCGAAAYDRACPRLRLRRLAEAGAELVAAAQAAVDDPEEFNDMAFTPQRLTKAIAKYEQEEDKQK